MAPEQDEQPRPVDINRRRLLLTAGSLAVAAGFAGITADRVKGNDGPAGPRTTAAARTTSTSSAATTSTTATVGETTGTASSSSTSATATATPSGEGRNLDEAVKAAVGDHDQVGVAVYDKRSGKSYSYQGDWLGETASIVKVMIVSSALRQAREGGARLSANRRALAKLSITQSDNDASTALYRYGGSRGGLLEVARAVGMDATVDASAAVSWGRTRTTANDQRALISALAYGSDYLEDEDRSYLWDLMGQVVPGQRWGVGDVEKYGGAAHLKNGWLALSPDNRWRINTIGHVSGPAGRDYVLTILSSGHRSQGAGTDFVNGISDAVYASLSKPYEG